MSRGSVHETNNRRPADSGVKRGMRDFGGGGGVVNKTKMEIASAINNGGLGWPADCKYAACDIGITELDEEIAVRFFIDEPRIVRVAEDCVAWFADSFEGSHVFDYRVILQKPIHGWRDFHLSIDEYKKMMS